MLRHICGVLLVCCCSPALADTKLEDDDTFFELKIRPVLSRSCFKCHGGDRTSNGLRLDAREHLLKGGDSGPAVVPGDPERSLLIKAIRHVDEHLKMPPKGRVSDSEVEDFVSWVRKGAHWPKSAVLQRSTASSHWSFQSVKAVLPPPAPSRWSECAIDQFIATERRKRGLQPVAMAEKRTLCRRLYFDLIGLPPTPNEVDAFLADETPEAYPKLVNRLLASPHYGERWGRHWMDVARYADTAGDNADYPIPEARLYRDYIIDSFNADKPYDQFVREQLAGDILAKQGPPDKYAERVIATGFLALSRRYATGPYELWHLTLEDTIETTGRAFMGLTLRCARCHDHKFDPVTKEDYYALYGIFASTQFPWAGAEEFASMKRPREHFVALLQPGEAEPHIHAFQQKIHELDDQISRLSKQGAPDARLKQIQKERDRLARTNLPADLPGSYAVQEGKPVHAHTQVRGEPNQPGPVVKRNVIAFLSREQPVAIADHESGRYQLALWLTRPEHPLTARVMVNRIWQHHFGKGLVDTPSNFGMRGGEPSHPELLDWLADQFVKSGWSVKEIHRLILLSKTYRLSCCSDDSNVGKDPGNRWYWRFDRRRLEAEPIRDAMLAISGRLDLSRPGEHPFPSLDQWRWTQHTPFKDVYPSNHRSVYLMTQRLQRHPFLALFDGPDTNATTDVRTSSTVPLQALFMMNNALVIEQAEGFARRVLAAVPEVRSRIQLAHRLAWSRLPTAEEIQKGVAYLGAYRDELNRVETPSEQVELEAWTSYARILLGANEFVYVD